MREFNLTATSADCRLADCATDLYTEVSRLSRLCNLDDETLWVVVWKSAECWDWRFIRSVDGPDPDYPRLIYRVLDDTYLSRTLCAVLTDDPSALLFHVSVLESWSMSDFFRRLPVYRACRIFQLVKLFRTD